jgi:hypothetical protein
MTTPAVRINMSDFAGSDPATSGQSISTDLFGGIYTGFQSRQTGLSEYAAHAEALSSTNIRWPGGTYAKSATDTSDLDRDGNTTEFIYDLSNRDICLKADAAGSDFGLSGVLQHASNLGVAVSMIVPVDRWYGDVQAGTQNFETFLERLLLTKDFGELPKTLLLEFGNEDGAAGDPQAAANYAQTVDAFLTTYRTFISGHAAEIDISPVALGVQTGVDEVADQIIRDGISSQNYGLIDQAIIHELNINIRNGQQKSAIYDGIIDAWQDQFGKQLTINASAWTVGDADPAAYENETYMDVGAMQPRTVLDTLVGLSRSDVTWGSLWGIDIGMSANGLPVNPNWMSSGYPGQMLTSHGGEAFRLMAEALPGTKLLNGIDGIAQKGPLQNGDFPGLPEYALQAFQGDDRLVLFVAANDLALGSATIDLDLSDYAITGPVEMTRLSTIWNDPSLKYDDLPVQSTSLLPMTGSQLSVTLGDDYEFVRLIIPIDSAPVTSSVRNTMGTSGADTFRADGLVSQMVGGAGNDTYVFDRFGDCALERPGEG